ncbi:MAG: GNAT family N-acetyltransferase [Ignavibacteriae bacterium]|nr:GNAT family N-acetyltransferase [Ignavibacteriota bacterium]
MKRLVKGKIYDLVKFKSGDDKLYDLIHGIFNEEIVKGFISPEYLMLKSRNNVKKWVDSNSKCKRQVWYAVRFKRQYIGYINYKWNECFEDACELSIVLAKGFRGFETGYIITKTLIDYLLKEKLFKYIIAYSIKSNKLAEKLLRKLGFKKSNRLHTEITEKLYSENVSLNIKLHYNLFTISTK